MSFRKLESAGYLANHMARLFAHGLHDRIRPLGLAPAQFMTLLELWAEDGLTQSDLVIRLDVEQATMANTLSRMERDGFIRRKPHPDDKRARQNWLTAKGRNLQEPATEAAKAQNETALKSLSRKEREVFLRLMQQTIASMKRAGTRP